MICSGKERQVKIIGGLVQFRYGLIFKAMFQFISRSFSFTDKTKPESCSRHEPRTIRHVQSWQTLQLDHCGRDLDRFFVVIRQIFSSSRSRRRKEKRLLINNYLE